MKKVRLVLLILLLGVFQFIFPATNKISLFEKISLSEPLFNRMSDIKFEESDSVNPWLQIPLNLSADLYSVIFINDSIGFAVGFKSNWYSLILKTTDGGSNWSECNINTRLRIYSIAQVDSNTLIAVGGGWNGVAFESLIFRSSNLGETWSRINLSDTYRLSAVSFNQHGFGVIVGESQIVYTTTNKGLSWTKKHNPTEWPDDLSDVCFIDSINILAVGNYGKILKSTDLGETWDSLNSTTTKYLNAIEIIDGNLFIAGESGLVLFSSDFGNSWQTQTKVTTSHLLGIHFIDPSNGFIVGGRNDVPGNKNSILKTTDAGLTWQKQSHSLNYILQDVYFINELVGFAVGDSGLILKTTNGGVTFIEEGNNFTQPKQFLLQQNYPNPFNPSTKISWKSPVGSWQTLKVYDILGNEVATLVDEYRNAGSYEIEFGVKSLELSSGIYFYQLRAGDYIETKKMNLLK